jgi:hypothetical protein
VVVEILRCQFSSIWYLWGGRFGWGGQLGGETRYSNWITAKKSPTPNPKLIAAFALGHLSVDGDVEDMVLTPMADLFISRLSEVISGMGTVSGVLQHSHTRTD